MYYLKYLIGMCLFREKHSTEEKYNLQHNNEIDLLNEGKGGGAMEILIFMSKSVLTFYFTHFKIVVIF